MRRDETMRMYPLGYITERIVSGYIGYDKSSASRYDGKIESYMKCKKISIHNWNVGG